MRFLPFIVAAVAVGTAACGSFPKPEAQVASSQGALSGAQEAGAAAVPQASLHLKLAQEERDQAMAALNNGDNERAHYLFMRSEADAQLANALAREDAANKEVAQTAEQVDLLKKKAAAQ